MIDTVLSVLGKKTLILRRLVPLAFLPLLAWLRVPCSHADWLLDEERYHVSVHGQLSCHDCHEDTAAAKPHPDPGNVNRTVVELLRPERCGDCHSEVLEEIETGVHGGKKAEDRESFATCTDCHDPHAEPASSASGGRADLTRPHPEKCGTCHESRPALPEPSAPDASCVECHRSVAPADPRAAEKISRFCFHCHGSPPRESTLAEPFSGCPPLAESGYASSAHSGLPCTTCHLGAAAYPHSEQKLAECGACHQRHDEKVAHDAHLTVRCESCHLRGVLPVKDPGSGRILWRVERKPGRPSEIHDMSWPGSEDACRRCHFRGNRLGASAHVLPAKSILCMPCHGATLSVSDGLTAWALLILCGGMAVLASVWMSGSLGREGEKSLGIEFLGLARAVAGTLFSRKLFRILASLALDGFLQRRLFRQSRTRWTIHALIFFPFVVRFFWGLAGLLASLWTPGWPGTWVLVDRDHPATAFLFDLTGLLVLAGVALAVVRRARTNPAQRLPGLPRPDRAAFGMLAGIVVTGFVLEGMRIGMTGGPGGSADAFVGYGLSRLLWWLDLTGVYGCGWYVHAALTAAFVAYLPFSRMLHLVMAPVSLALRAASGHPDVSGGPGP